MTIDLKSHAARFAACETTGLAQKIFQSLSLLEKLTLFEASPDKCLFFASQSSNLPAVEGMLADTGLPVTTQRQVNALYQPLFSYLQQELHTAHQNKQSFQIFLGENHTDRNGLLISCMVMHIAQRLGIHNLGVEKKEEDAVYTNKEGIEKIIYGVQTLLDQTNNNHIPDEKNPEHSFLGSRMNNEYHIWLAKKQGMDIFGSDPAEKSDSRYTTQKDVFPLREKASEEIYARYARERQDFVTIHGFYHLPGFSKTSPDNAHRISINTTQKFHFSASYRPDNIEIIARPGALLTEHGVKPIEGNHSPVLHAILPGKGITALAEQKSVSPAALAIEMAEEADRTVGRELAPTWAEEMLGRRTAGAGKVR